MEDKEMVAVEQVNNLSALTAATPEEMIKRASYYASALSKVIKDKNLSTQIQGKEYVNIEGWSTLGSLLGVMPQIEWTRKCDGKDEGDIAYEARAVLKTVSGQIVGAGEAMATKSEGKPWGANLFSIRSMAETRATGKAFRLSFSWIMKMAGYEGTPMEEMTREEKEVIDPKSKASVNQVSKIFALAKENGITDAVFTKEWVKNKFELESFNDLNTRQASLIIGDFDIPFGETQMVVDWKKETEPVKPKTKSDDIKEKVKGTKFDPNNKKEEQIELTAEEVEVKEVFNES